MKKITKILCPVDFSDASANAFRHALLLADQFNAKVELLHVIYPQGEAMDFPVLVAEMTQQKIEISKELLKNFADIGITQVLQRIKNIPVINSDVEVGTIVNSIVSTAKRDEADLIVIGRSGENTSRLKKLMGSVAAGVVKKSTCPVVVVPVDSKFKQVTTIAYATDMLASDPYELWKTTKLLEAFNAIIHCVHFNSKRDDAGASAEKLKDMELFFADHAPGLQINFHNLTGSNLEADLNEFAKTYDVDLLVMYQPDHSLWDRLFSHSATAGMAIESKLPLLIQKEEK